MEIKLIDNPVRLQTFLNDQANTGNIVDDGDRYFIKPDAVYLGVYEGVPEKGQQVINRKMEARIANSAAWQSFYRTLTREEKQAIARVGIIGWLSGEADGSEY